MWRCARLAGYWGPWETSPARVSPAFPEAKRFSYRFPRWARDLWGDRSSPRDKRGNMSMGSTHAHTRTHMHTHTHTHTHTYTHTHPRWSTFPLPFRRKGIRMPGVPACSRLVLVATRGPMHRDSCSLRLARATPMSRDACSVRLARAKLHVDAKSPAIASTSTTDGPTEEHMETSTVRDAPHQRLLPHPRQRRDPWPRADVNPISLATTSEVHGCVPHATAPRVRRVRPSAHPIAHVASTMHARRRPQPMDAPWHWDA